MTKTAILAWTIVTIVLAAPFAVAAYQLAQTDASKDG
jgi:hypothetical protein